MTAPLILRHRTAPLIAATLRERAEEATRTGQPDRAAQLRRLAHGADAFAQMTRGQR